MDARATERGGILGVLGRAVARRRGTVLAAPASDLRRPVVAFEIPAPEPVSYEPFRDYRAGPLGGCGVRW